MTGWRDNQFRYGKVTRLLHWAMALLLAWQFAGMIIKEIVGRAPITAFWVGTHVSVGTLLLTLFAVRAVWGLYNLSRRPGHASGFLGLASIAGHLALYALMLIVPSLGVLRAYGSGRGLTAFGLELLPATGREVEWMVAPANAAHGTLAWLLLVLIAGHVVMALFHHFVQRDDTLARMTNFAPLPAKASEQA